MSVWCAGLRCVCHVCVVCRVEVCVCHVCVVCRLRCVCHVCVVCRLRCVCHVCVVCRLRCGCHVYDWCAGLKCVSRVCHVCMYLAYRPFSSNGAGGGGHQAYHTYCAALVETELDVLTGEYAIRRVDIVFDCGER